MQYLAWRRLDSDEPGKAQPHRRIVQILVDHLRSRVLAGEWEVVAQITLQLRDRMLDGGADDLLRLVLEEESNDPSERQRFREFAVSALDYIHPARDLLLKN